MTPDDVAQSLSALWQGRSPLAVANQLGLRALAEFLDRGYYQPHIDEVRGVYRRKRDLIHQALVDVGLDEYLEWNPPKGGFYIWAKLRPGLDCDAVWRTGVHEGIAVSSGKGFSPLGTSQHIRIAYPWAPEESFVEAARRLRIACDRVAAGDAA